MYDLGLVLFIGCVTWALMLALILAFLRPRG